MKILILTQFFPPEVGAASTRVLETAQCLKNMGHKISILTAFPNYLMSSSLDKYKGKFRYFEKIDGIKVYRSYIYSNFRRSLFCRFIGFFSFMFSSIILGLSIKKSDILIATSPPFSTGISGFIIAKLKGSKFVFEVRDIYPKTAIELNIINNKLIIRFLSRIEEYLYQKADLLIALTNGILNHFEQIDEGKKSILITNGVYLNKFSHTKEEQKDIIPGIQDSDFVLLNIGILGRIHSLETIIESLAMVEIKNLKMLFVGDGVEEAKLKSKVKELGLKNVMFVKNQKKENIPTIIKKSDICFVTTKKLELTTGTLPVKMFEYMACGKPIIAAVHGEAEVLIKDAKVGIVVEPENPEQMAKAILKLYNNTKLLKIMGSNGPKYVSLNYSREILVRKYESRLKKILYH